MNTFLAWFLRVYIEKSSQNLVFKSVDGYQIFTQASCKCDKAEKTSYTLAATAL